VSLQVQVQGMNLQRYAELAACSTLWRPSADGDGATLTWCRQP
jgi:hypothetical protein